MLSCFTKQSVKLRLFLTLMSVFLTAAPAKATEMVDRALAAGFVPHKALYDITLAGTKSGSQIVNINGQMFYEWQPTCGAWTSNHRFNLFYEYADTPSMQITSDFSTYETFDGKTMNFTSQRKRDGQLFEEMRGAAEIGPDGTGSAIFTIPKDLEFNLPEGSVFPMMHSLNVFQALKKGEKFYKAVIFDGSDQEGPVEINAFIGKPVNAVAELNGSPDLDMTLVNIPAHQIRLAFFPLSDSSGVSDYEMTINFHENSVISEMLIEYDDFTVRQKLIAIEKLADSCETGQNSPPETP